MVVPADLCWGLAAEAQQVVIMGTQYYDGSAGGGGVDYPVTDLLQMMGRAIRAKDTPQGSGRCASDLDSQLLDRIAKRCRVTVFTSTSVQCEPANSTAHPAISRQMTTHVSWLSMPAADACAPGYQGVPFVDIEA
jgi:replicative superfamily II helicase